MPAASLAPSSPLHSFASDVGASDACVCQSLSPSVLNLAVRRILVLLIFGLLGAVAACSSKPESPETKITALLKSAEQAAEAKDLNTLRDYLSERYSDGEQHNKKAIERLLRLHFLRNEKIHLFTRVQSFSLPEPARAQVVLFVAMAGEPIATADDVPRVRADLHRFELTFRDENGRGEWKVVQAQWRRAAPSDVW